MYRPKHFREHDRGHIVRLMRDNSFALVVSRVADKLEATHLPLLIDEREASIELTGHLARANPQWRGWEASPEIMCVFTGPHGYVSPTLYAGDDDVPTWNYQVVHAYGRIELVREPAALRDLLRRTVNLYEGRNGTAWTIDDADARAVDAFVRQVVGFRIEVTKIEAASKLSQDKSAADRSAVTAAFAASSDTREQDLAAAMTAGAPRDV